MRNKAWFCQQLAEWLDEADWHYTTLLAAAIHSVKHLPDNMDKLIHDILNRYPARPDKQSLISFLCDNRKVYRWFKQKETPEILRINLIPQQQKKLANSQLPTFQNVGDLSDWLGVSQEKLEWLAGIWRKQKNRHSCLDHYSYYIIPKRGGRSRLIESPKSLLKKLQRRITRKIIYHMRIHEHCFGFQAGKNCQQHALLHVGQKTLLQFDISNCFQSTQWSMVYGCFVQLGYTEKIATYLTALCTHECTLDSPELLQQLDHGHIALLRQRHLAQGAPSSPALSNAVLYRLDKRLHGLAEKMGMIYSRYADDFVFSSNGNHDYSFLQTLVGAICLEEGFQINYHKSRIAKSHQKQRVTGIIVNEKINIDRQSYDQLKAILTNSVRYGLDSQNRDNHPNFREHLMGRVQYVKSLNKAKGEKLERLFERI